MKKTNKVVAIFCPVVALALAGVTFGIFHTVQGVDVDLSIFAQGGTNCRLSVIDNDTKMTTDDFLSLTNSKQTRTWKYNRIEQNRFMQNEADRQANIKI